MGGWAGWVGGVGELVGWGGYLVITVSHPTFCCVGVRVRPNGGFFKFGRSRTFQNSCSVNRSQSRTLEIEVRLKGTELLC